MRALLIVVLVVSALWAGYWVVGSQAMERGVTGWFAAQDGGPLTAEQQGITVAGFPNRFDLTVTEPRLSNAETGVGVSNVSGNQAWNGKIADLVIAVSTNRNAIGVIDGAMFPCSISPNKTLM